MRKLFIAVAVLILFVGNALADVTRHIPALWSETADSAKIFIYSTGDTTTLDSSAGAARTSTVSYDTTVTLSLEDSAYSVVVKIWYAGAPGPANWIFTYLTDTTTFQGAASSLDTTAIKAMMRNNGPLFAYVSPLNTVRNPGFEDDSVTTTTPPAGWTQGVGDEAGSGIRIAGAGGGRHQYAIASSTNTTTILYQRVGLLSAGHYWLGGTVHATSTVDAYILIDDAIPTTTSAHIDSVTMATSGITQEIGKVVELTAQTDVYVGLRIDEVVGGDTLRVDNIKLIPITLDSSAYQGPGSDTTDILAMFINNFDSLMHNINDSVWLELVATLNGVAGSFGDSSGGWGATAAGALTGGNFTAALGTVDTLSGTAADTLVPFINVDFFNLAGNFLGRLQSDVNGYIPLGIDSGRYLVRASNVFNNTYIFPTHAGGFDTIHIFANGDTIPSSLAHADSVAVDSAVTGYNFVIGVPTGDSVCRVYGFIRDAAQDGIKGVTVEASLRQGGAWDTVANVFITSDVIPTKTDATGYWFLDLSRSSSLDPEQDYIFSAYKRNIEYFTRIIRTVPDSTSHRLGVR